MVNIVLQMLAALSCVLFAACADVMPPADFTPEGMAGTWYNVGIAANGRWLRYHKKNFKMRRNIMTITDTGDLDYSTVFLTENGSCWRVPHLAKKTGTPGRYTFYSETNNEDFRVVDVVYDNYAIAHHIIGKNSRVDFKNHLFSRTTEVSADLQEKFKQYCLSTGILAENIVMLPKSVECPED